MKIDISKLSCPDTLEIKSDEPGTPGVFIVKHNDGVSAFVNSCPHAGAPLNWQSNQFFDIEQKLLQCSLHGAQFRFDDGFCVTGPCANKSLTPVAIRVEGDQVHIETNAPQSE